MSDKKVYDKVREAATSLATAGRRLRRQPEPKHTGRKLAAAAAIAGGAAYAVKKKRSSNGAEYEGQTVAAAPAPFTNAPMPAA